MGLSEWLKQFGRNKGQTSSFGVDGLGVDEILAKLMNSEKLLESLRTKNCWVCGGTEKIVIGNIWEDDEIILKCTNPECGAEVRLPSKYIGQAVSTKKNALVRLKELIERDMGEKMDTTIVDPTPEEENIAERVIALFKRVSEIEKRVEIVYDYIKQKTAQKKKRPT